MTRSRTAFALAAGATGTLVVLGASPALADDHTATVSVLHGVPDTPVDVYANGERLIDDFQPGTLTDPLELPAGSYDLALYPADAPDASGDPLLSADGVSVPAGADATVVAHLTESGQPALTPFVNDTSTVPAGQARVTVRHVAAAPAVDVRAGGSVIVEALTNPNEASLETAAGSVSADVVLAGTDTVAIGPADLELAEGANSIVTAWGSAEDGNLALAVQVVEAHSAPSGVPSGLGGAEDQRALGISLLLAGALGLALVATRTLRPARERS